MALLEEYRAFVTCRGSYDPVVEYRAPFGASYRAPFGTLCRAPFGTLHGAPFGRFHRAPLGTYLSRLLRPKGEAMRWSYA